MAVVLVWLLLGGPLAAQVDPGPPWRDLDAATSQLQEAQAEVADAQQMLEDAQTDAAELQADLALRGEDELAYAIELQEQGALVRDLAVEAYISRGPVAEAIYLIDSATVSDLAYRTGILRGSADAVASTSRDFLALRDGASSDALAIALEIDAAVARTDGARARIANAESLVAEAEYVVWIAEIHDRADALKERNGFPEPTSQQWADLRFCESTENYRVATGNGYWGAYQFDIATWSDMGGTGLPSDAPTEEQDARARYLYHLRGWGPWPVCGRFLPQDSPGPR